MKTLALTLALVGLGAAAQADPVLGTWRSQPGDTGATIDVRIAPCDTGGICGVIAALNGPGDRSVVGKPIIWSMNPDGGGRYSGGKIWAPDQDRTYNSKMTLQGDALQVEGCVLGFCRGQTWSRID